MFIFLRLLFVYDVTVLYLCAACTIDGGGGGAEEIMEIKTRSLEGGGQMKIN